MRRCGTPRQPSKSRALNQRLDFGVDFDARCISSGIDLAQPGIDRPQQVHRGLRASIEGISTSDRPNRVLPTRSLQPSPDPDGLLLVRGKRPDQLRPESQQVRLFLGHGPCRRACEPKARKCFVGRTVGDRRLGVDRGIRHLAEIISAAINGGKRGRRYGTIQVPDMEHIQHAPGIGNSPILREQRGRIILKDRKSVLLPDYL